MATMVKPYILRVFFKHAAFSFPPISKNKDGVFVQVGSPAYLDMPLGQDYHEVIRETLKNGYILIGPIFIPYENISSMTAIAIEDAPETPDMPHGDKVLRFPNSGKNT